MNSGRRGRTTVAMVNGAFSAVVRHEDDTLTELKTDPVTGKITKYEKPIPNGLLYCLPKVIAEIVEIRISKSKARGGRGSGPTTDEQRRNSEFWSETQFRRGA